MDAVIASGLLAYSLGADFALAILSISTGFVGVAEPLTRLDTFIAAEEMTVVTFDTALALFTDRSAVASDIFTALIAVTAVVDVGLEDNADIACPVCGGAAGLTCGAMGDAEPLRADLPLAAGAALDDVAATIHGHAAAQLQLLAKLGVAASVITSAAPGAALQVRMAVIIVVTTLARLAEPLTLVDTFTPAIKLARGQRKSSSSTAASPEP